MIDTIAQKENLVVDENAKNALFAICDGDCRKLENIMQSCAVINTTINTELVYSMASAAKPQEIKQIITLALKQNFLEARKKLLNLMLNYGLSGLDVIKQISKEVWNVETSDDIKVTLIDKCGEIEFRMVEGSDEYIQLESFLAFVVMVGSR